MNSSFVGYQGSESSALRYSADALPPAGGACSLSRSTQLSGTQLVDVRAASDMAHTSEVMVDQDGSLTGLQPGA